jgi:hypothetical protein
MTPIFMMLAATAIQQTQSTIHGVDLAKEFLQSSDPVFKRLPTDDIIFDGGSTDALTHTDGSAVKWKVVNGELLADPKTGSLITKSKYGNSLVHFEFYAPGGPDSGEGSNSGIKLQTFYEIQIRGTAADYKPNAHGIAAIYTIKAADVNASLGYNTWQSFDVLFKAATWKDGEKVTNAFMSIWWNGRLVHSNVEVPRKTGVSAQESPGPHPLMLTSHGSDVKELVRMRNVWVRPL